MRPEDYSLLVVDDLEENRDLLSRRLARRGYQVLVAEGGQKALDLIRTQPIDLVLLDVMMPGMSGIEVLVEARKTFTSADLPIVMVTAKSESDDVVEALDAGANDYVTKPIDFPVVLARVQSQLRARKSRKAIEAAAREAAAQEVAAGAVLAGKYRLEVRIGAGNFGAVWRAKHVDLDRHVAVKVLQASMGSGDEAVARFRREGISACRVRHPNAVAVLDSGISASGVAFLIMELLEGHSLQEELTLAETLPPTRCAQVLVPVCEVLAAAHEAGIIHRDVKPSNIFLHSTPHGEQPKVLDFGIAKIAGDHALGGSLTVEGHILGTPAYMAPERFRGAGYDAKADVYSVGVTLFQMLEGRLPFRPPSPDPMAMAMAHMNDAPPPLTRLPAEQFPELPPLLRRALAKDPAERPTAEELARELARVVGIEVQPSPSLASDLETLLAADFPSAPAPDEVTQVRPATAIGGEPTLVTPLRSAEAEAAPVLTLASDVPTLLARAPTPLAPVAVVEAPEGGLPAPPPVAPAAVRQLAATDEDVVVHAEPELPGYQPLAGIEPGPDAADSAPSGDAAATAPGERPVSSQRRAAGNDPIEVY